jgi:DNA-binding NarL/FixJ family response regulator
VALRCLLVDDNPQFLAVASRLLESQGLSIVGAASTSDEAERLTAELRPDVALVDVQLGEEDGVELAARLARVTAVILISTHSEDELGEMIADNPARGFVPKQSLGAAAISALLD